MKKFICFIAVSALIFTATAGFSQERNLTPTEEVVYADLAYDNVVVSSFAEINTVDFTDYEAISAVGQGLLFERTDVGLASTFYFLVYKACDYPHLNEWKTNKSELANRHEQISISHGGDILKISLV